MTRFKRSRPRMIAIPNPSMSCLRPTAGRPFSNLSTRTCVKAGDSKAVWRSPPPAPCSGGTTRQSSGSDAIRRTLRASSTRRLVQVDDRLLPVGAQHVQESPADLEDRALAGELADVAGAL